MKKVISLSLLTFLIVLCLSSSFCDSMTLSDNRDFPQVRVDLFAAGSPEASFKIRVLQNGQLSQEAFPLSESKIQKIQFNPLNVDSAQTLGAPANLALKDGRRFDGVTVVSFEQTPQGGTFMIRQAGVAPSDQAHPVQSALISEIQFIVTSQPIPSPTQDLSSLMLGNIATIPTPTPEVDEEEEGTGVYDDEMEQLRDKMEKKLEEREAEWSRQGAGEELVGNIQIRLIATIISASIGGLVVFLIMKNKGEPVTWGKAFLTGVLLATIPGLVLFICTYFIPICCFGFLTGIVAWFYTARLITMSVLDVKSPTATTIVIVWFFFYLVVIIGVAFIVAGAMVMRALSG